MNTKRQDSISTLHQVRHSDRIMAAQSPTNPSQVYVRLGTLNVRLDLADATRLYAVLGAMLAQEANASAER